MKFDSSINRERQIRSRYGITVEMHKWLLTRQKGICCLCGLEESSVHYRSRQLVRFHVDHSHDCKCKHESARKGCVHCIRGMVCASCNRTLLPLVERSPLLSERFKDYLGRRPLLERFPDWDCTIRDVTRRRRIRQDQVAFLRNQDLTFREIAEKLSIAHSTAVRDYQAWVRMERDNVEGPYDT